MIGMADEYRFNIRFVFEDKQVINIDCIFTIMRLGQL